MDQILGMYLSFEMCNSCMQLLFLCIIKITLILIVIKQTQTEMAYKELLQYMKLLSRKHRIC